MGAVTKKMLDLLSEFLICEIGSKTLDGITYTMVTNSEKDKEDCKRYMEVRKAVDEAGFGKDEIFRVYKLSNGYIFDMDLNIAKNITKKLSQAVYVTNGKEIPSDFDPIGQKPEQRRKSDLDSLAHYLKNEYEAGRDIVEVALFNRNSVRRIVVTGKDPKGRSVMIKYNAYAIRHWDIETLNSRLLMPAGIRVSRVEPFDILPSKNGVRFQLTLEAINL